MLLKPFKSYLYRIGSLDPRCAGFKVNVETPLLDNAPNPPIVRPHQNVCSGHADSN
jgi:hypothetical protein